MAQTQTMVKFYTCTQQAYTNATKIEGALYFTTDTKRLYKGSTLYGGSFEYLASIQGKTGNVDTLYYVADTGNISIWDGEKFVAKFLPYSDTVNSSSTNLTVPTSKAVYDAIDAEATQRDTDDQVLSGAIDKLNGNDTTAGSVAKAVKDAKDAISGAIGADFNSTDTVKKYIDDKESALSDDIDYVSGVVQTINGTDSTAGSFRAGDKAITDIIGTGFDSTNTIAKAIEDITTSAISVSGITDTAIEVVESGAGNINKGIGLKINANDKFLSQSSDGLSATISLVKAETLLSGDVNAAEYYLVGSDGTTPIGARINIPKDQFLKSVTFKQGSGSGDDYLEFVFNTATGTEDTVNVPLSGLFDEYTAGAGIDLTKTATGIEISGVVDNSSETFLTVGENGFKLSGVQNAIDAGDEALSGAIGAGFKEGETVKSYIDDIQTTLSGQIGSGFGSGTISGTVAEYINTRVNGLASSSTLALEGKLDDVDENKAGEIIIAKADGKIETSGKSVGGSTIAAEPTANTVATEAAVSAFVDTKIEDALTGALTWNTLP